MLVPPRRVYFMEIHGNPIEMDDLGIPPFQETSMSPHVFAASNKR